MPGRCIIYRKHYSLFQRHREMSATEAPEIVSPSPDWENHITEIVDATTTVGTVKLVDEASVEDCTFSLVEGKEDILLLLDKQNRVAGMCDTWYDETDYIPNEMKDQDGAVLHPETGEPLFEFKMTNSDYIPDGVYREYRYLPEHGNLQQTYNVTVDWY